MQQKRKEWVLVFIVTIIACGIGTWLGFLLGEGYVHAGGWRLVAAFILVWPYLVAGALFEKIIEHHEYVFWAMCGVFQITYYSAIVWLVRNAVCLSKRKL